MKDIVFRTIMLKGAAGNDITGIEKTSSSGNVDTYTITLSDGSTETFTVTNGTSIESIEKTSTSGLIDTYTITLTDGSTTTFEVANGENAQVYEIPKDSVIGFDSEDATPAGYDEISSPYDAALSLTSDNAIQNKAVKAAIDSLTTAINSLYYHKGDTIQLKNGIYSGQISNSGKTFTFWVPLDKPLSSDVSSVSVSDLKGDIYGANKKLISNTQMSTIGTISNPAITPLGIRFAIVLNSAPTGVLDGTIASLYVFNQAPQGTITFS